MNRMGIHEGMKVFTSDKRALGKVWLWGDERFLVRKGLVFRDKYNLLFDQVSAVVGESVQMKETFIELDADRQNALMGLQRLPAQKGVVIPADADDLSSHRMTDDGGPAHAHFQ